MDSHHHHHHHRQQHRRWTGKQVLAIANHRSINSCRYLAMKFYFWFCFFSRERQETKLLNEAYRDWNNNNKIFISEQRKKRNFLRFVWHFSSFKAKKNQTIFFLSKFVFVLGLILKNYREFSSLNVRLSSLVMLIVFKHHHRTSRGLLLAIKWLHHISILFSLQ